MSWGLTVLLAFVSLQGSIAELCYGLGLEGGGSRGAYEVGALWALTNYLPADEVRWNIITGVSTGALNAGGFSLYPYGEEIAAANFLLETWQNITGDDDIYDNWVGGKVEGVLFKSGIYDNEPLKRLVRNLIGNNTAQRNVTIVSTDITEGKPHWFNETYPSLIDAVIASSSAPLDFPTHIIDGRAYSDGGDTINLDVFTIIQRCEALVGNDSNIVVDLIYLEPGFLDVVASNYTWTTSDVNSRVSDLRTYYHRTWYTLAAQVAHPDVNYRYVIGPASELPGGFIPLNFTPSSLEAMIQEGIQDAILAINGTSNYNAKNFHQSLNARIYASDCG